MEKYSVYTALSLPVHMHIAHGFADMWDHLCLTYFSEELYIEERNLDGYIIDMVDWTPICISKTNTEK